MVFRIHSLRRGREEVDMPGNDRFNAEAAAWDSNPDVHRASESAKDALIARFPRLKPDTDKNGQGAFLVGTAVRSLTQLKRRTQCPGNRLRDRPAVVPHRPLCALATRH